MEDLLKELARTNLSGAPFLFAYGITWIICGVVWVKSRASVAAIATLFQGMVALPVALFIMYLMGAFANRPDTGELDSLVIIIAMSQLLSLPLLIVMFRKQHYSLIPYVFSTVGAVHFVMYTWLYQTISYIVMPVIIVTAISVIYFLHSDKKGLSASGASKVCLVTGITLLLNAVYLSFTHLN
ncbi:DUF7010 family protein [Jeotgalibacillus campisalis]|uniref:Uncharacterized protein n=1 Tax=Jeotgalibacillus campisalis TaxID=220754 RepID=A0A0C2QYV6_9BACL|nr:hypothetical protein [Jeotgalibacillus campisalis]KIL43235.1 hypothetical protein KR50_36380 [Jeotgalibacillus campisalis]